MSYEPIHHKYRPQTFADLVGQDAIATTLSNAIRLTRIAPAYLFTGPRGTGKTSSARILSKSLNCLSSPVPTAQPCGTCDVCQSIARGGALDVIEIDAASNTGVDNIRELIERAQFAPVQCRYKIYCLDEVHMLSTAAFNALLKTLEEPPDRVVFILATTDPQRVLPTIISRCQRFDFRRIPLQAMIQHLTMIAQNEQIAIAPIAVEAVAQLAQGGLRDAESLLDQLSLLAGEITVDRVWDLVGSVPEQDLLALSQAIATANPEVILERTRHLLDRGREPLIVLQNLTGFYRDLLIAKTAPNRRDLVAVTESTWLKLIEFAQSLEMSAILAGQQHLRTCEVQVKNTTQPRLWLEVTLLGLIQSAASCYERHTRHSGVTAVSQAYQVPQPIASRPAIPVSATPPPQTADTVASMPSAASSALPLTPAPLTPIPLTIPIAAPSAAPSPAASPPPLQTSTTTERSVRIEEESPWPDDPLASPAVAEMDAATLPSIPAELALNTDLSTETPAAVPLPAPVFSIPASAPEPVLAPPEPNALDLAQIWRQLLGHLNRPSQALLSEHGQLISFKGREAQIGIRNGSLARIAQSKLPDVEGAFLKVFNRKVGVSLHIMTASAPAPTPDTPPSSPPTNLSALGSFPSYSAPTSPLHSSSPLSASPSTVPLPSAPPPSPFHPDRPQPSSLQPSPPSFNPSQSGSSLAAPTQAHPPSGVSPIAPSIREVTPQGASPPQQSSPPTPPWETYDELSHSARNFAQFFNGALVDLEGFDSPDAAALPPAVLLSTETAEGAEYEDPE